ncbi:hypothetical protein GOODEAATRI_006082 [Goodea atripinnis]|uniref:Uncharacterized protein n=1 Tax=Goodea atripinnis TaxID=208336 RepID=A0ABV0NS66_9TELE
MFSSPRTQPLKDRFVGASWFKTHCWSELVADQCTTNGPLRSACCCLFDRILWFYCVVRGSVFCSQTHLLCCWLAMIRGQSFSISKQYNYYQMLCNKLLNNLISLPFPNIDSFTVTSVQSLMAHTCEVKFSGSDVIYKLKAMTCFNQRTSQVVI